jgi:predicted DNA-binding ribbon-helix-helix protein
MVLPSNGCPNTQPDNNASSFVTDWESPINLKGNWEVALSEYSLTYFHQVINTPSKIRYHYYTTRRTTFVLSNEEGKLKIDDEFENKKKGSFHITRNSDGILYVISLARPFFVSLDNLAEAQILGFPKIVNRIYDNVGIGGDVPVQMNKLTSSINLDVIQPIIDERYDWLTFDKYILFPKADDLAEYFRFHGAKVFEEFKIDQNGFVSFTMKDTLNTLLFTGSLARYLGFDGYIFKNGSKKQFNATRKPRLAPAYSQLYIYSDITDPILVGGVRVPLLRTVWVETKYNPGNIIHQSIERPMYLPISANSINNIEVQIRYDSGKIIKFPHGSVTTLILHFRKNE